MKEYTYKAFITYSHDDSRVASWLQRALESYRVPSRFVGRKSSPLNIPGRLRPIFRDRGELPAGSDLEKKVNHALASSEYLIVVCSPAAARSKWVNLEISQFRKTHDDDKILCLIVAGEPFASDHQNQSDEECFPAALGYRESQANDSVAAAVEPVAADLRRGSDGRRLAKLKIVAGLIGVGLDALAQRDAQRRHLRMLGVSFGSVAGMVAMAILSFVAIEAKNNEQLRRAEAEDLIEFMLSDLRQQLEAVGRLDVLDAVGQEAIKYYSKVELSQHSEASLGRRARAFHLLGEVDDLRGDMEKARGEFNEAYDSTSELLRRSPNDGERVYNHAQSVFWVGYLDWRLGNYDAARKAFQEYVSLGTRLIEIDPTKVEWLVELSYANINLGVYTLETGSTKKAIDLFQQAQSVIEDAIEKQPDNTDWRIQLAQTHAWSADAHLKDGSISTALNHRLTEVEIYRNLLVREPDNQDINQTLIASHSAQAGIWMHQGNVTAAIDDLLNAKRYGDNLLKLDADNTFTAQITAIVYVDLAEAYGYVGNTDSARNLLEHAEEMMAGLAAKDPKIVEWQLLLRRILILETQYNAESNSAAASERELLTNINELKLLRESSPDVVSIRHLIAFAHLQLANTYALSGDNSKATTQLDLIIDELSPIEDTLPLREIALLAHAYARTDKSGKAVTLNDRLQSVGFRHPEFRAMQ